MKARPLLRQFCRAGDPPGVFRAPLPRAQIDNRKVELDYHSTEPNSYFAHGEHGHAPPPARDQPQIYFDHVRRFSAEYRPWVAGHGGNGFFLFAYLFCWLYLGLYLHNAHQRRGKPRDRNATFLN